MSNEGSTAMVPDPKRYVDIALLLYTFTYKTMALEKLREEAVGAARGLEKIALVLKKCPEMVESMDDKELAKETGVEGHPLVDFLRDDDELRELCLKVTEAMEAVAEDREKLLEFPEGEALVHFIESRKTD